MFDVLHSTKAGKEILTQCGQQGYCLVWPSANGPCAMCMQVQSYISTELQML